MYKFLDWLFNFNTKKIDIEKSILWGLLLFPLCFLIAKIISTL
jgi:hypothetical protein